MLLNIDLGELPDEAEALYEVAQIANIACGGHAGDASTMHRALQRCLRYGTRVSAHPSYPDREGFGRRRIAIPLDDLRASIAEQCASLASVAKTAGDVPVFVKAHGALYHAAGHDPEIAAVLLQGSQAALGDDIAFIGPPEGELRKAVTRAGLGYLREGFADRGLRADGTLIPRGEPGALLTDPADAVAQASSLMASGHFDTLCVHGDTPGAESIARAVRAALEPRAIG